MEKRFIVMMIGDLDGASKNERRVGNEVCTIKRILVCLTTWKSQTTTTENYISPELRMPCYFSKVTPHTAEFPTTSNYLVRFI